MTTTSDRMEALGVALPEAWRLPDGVHQGFAIVREHDGQVLLAGHGPVDGAQILMHGCVGDDLSVDDGYQSARLTAQAMVASLVRAVGDLDALTWLRATVYVNAVAGLAGPELTRVGDGFSDFVNEVFSERGEHARATIGVGSLAFNVPTIIEATLAR